MGASILIERSCCSHHLHLTGGLYQQDIDPLQRDFTLNPLVLGTRLSKDDSPTSQEEDEMATRPTRSLLELSCESRWAHGPIQHLPPARSLTLATTQHAPIGRQQSMRYPTSREPGGGVSPSEGDCHRSQISWTRTGTATAVIDGRSACILSRSAVAPSLTEVRCSTIGGGRIHGPLSGSKRIGMDDRKGIGLL
jgi:hypothetical protein